MLDLVLRNQDNIILGTFFAFLGVALSFLLAPPSDSVGRQQTHMKLVVVIERSQTIFKANSRGNNDDQNLLPLLLIVTVGVCFMYLLWRTEILITLASVSVFLMSFFCCASIYAYRNGVFYGSGWRNYLVFVVLAGMFSFVLISSAYQPNFGNEIPGSLEAIAKERGFQGIVDVASPELIGWTVFHILGVFMLIMLQIRIILSLAHYLAVAQYVISEGAAGIAQAVVMLTQSYQSPMRNVLTVTAFLVLSYSFINGYSYKLYMQLMT